MKKHLALLFLSAAFISSCSNDTELNADNTTSILQEGNWKVTSFIDSGQNETSHFAGHSFEFTSGGVVNVATGSANVQGSWSTGEDDSHVKLILSFSTNPHEEISDDWHVISQTSSKIELEDVSGGNGGVDYLTFER